MFKLITTNTHFRDLNGRSSKREDLFEPLNAKGKKLDPIKKAKWKELNRKIIG